MATITGLTAERMLEIEGQSVISGEIVNNHLILKKFDGTEIDAGVLPPGPQGPVGPAGGQIPGEIKMWPGNVLPDPVNFGKWVWADGATYDVALYPKAAANIAPQWRTFAGASDPPGTLFRVPDLRGLVPAGLDQMPGGSRANRLTRSVSIVIAGKTGEEIHTLTVAEMPSHSHSGSGSISDHRHVLGTAAAGSGNAGAVDDGRGGYGFGNKETGGVVGGGAVSLSIGASGGGAAHENLQPTVFVPYIVKLDD
jgi:microcystin-dependent protein